MKYLLLILLGLFILIIILFLFSSCILSSRADNYKYKKDDSK